jgi:hypothetical protein
MEECLHTREEDDEELDGLAIEECFHNREEEDCPDNPKDGDYDCDSIDEEGEDIRPAKRRRLVLRTAVSTSRGPMSNNPVAH